MRPHPRSSTCTPDNTTLCLSDPAGDDRFLARVGWRDFNGDTGLGIVVERFFDGGSFYFFDSDNPDLFVQLINNCLQDNNYLVSVASTTNVEFELTVLDTLTNVAQRFFNPLGDADESTTATFPACP